MNLADTFSPTRDLHYGGGKRGEGRGGEKGGPISALPLTLGGLPLVLQTGLEHLAMETQLSFLASTWGHEIPPVQITCPVWSYPSRVHYH